MLFGERDCCAFEMSENDETQYVIDGGSLLHRIHWQSGLSLVNLSKSNDSSVKVASVGQAIIQASRPRTLIAPLQIALSGTNAPSLWIKIFIGHFEHSWFRFFYTEVQRFELNAAAAAHDRTNTQFGNGTFVQYIADNVDHNLRTLDGHGTFHGMGMIAAVTPGFRLDKAVPRLSPTLKEVSDLAKINIEYYKMQSKQSLQAEFATMNYEPNMIDTTWKLDFCQKYAGL
ncbi:Hypothetical predicted protein [Mytilus galloprovincialis]|uniref:Uncharacterized protein n=1 Tax=Mytilus galloprovincialis TaxID=29158 RepID=A0A8B6F626_MYTGA|nr:Hypothetical predicted protein [Mytilus galloprovincialis]